MAKPSASEKSVFGRRLREARLRAGIAQEQLGWMIGLDEGCSSARMSRYENGIHEPAHLIVQLLAKALRIPSAYFYAEDDVLAEWILVFSQLKSADRKALCAQAQEMLDGKTN